MDNIINENHAAVVFFEEEEKPAPFHWPVGGLEFLEEDVAK